MRSPKPNRALLVAAVLNSSLAWGLAGFLWSRPGAKPLAVSLFGTGVSMGPCVAAYALAPLRRKQNARRIVLATGALSIMAFSVLSRTSIDLEGFFALLIAGGMGAAVGHTLITVIISPMLFGRFLCGWACWRAMILEILPVRASAGCRGGAWTLLPLAGFAASFGSAIFFHTEGLRAIAWGYAVYYAASIGLALALRDQRAFCKYVCPSGLILRQTSRISALKMSSGAEQCDGCGACSRICPMDIDVASFAVAGGSVTSGDCILCQRCAHVCPRGALGLTFAGARRPNAT
jgi:polyferredoxin